MDKFNLKGLAILLVLVVGALFALPTLVGELPDGWIGPKKAVNLGLDLQGGMHLVLRVDTDKAVENRLNSIGEGLKDGMIEKRIRYTRVAAKGSDSVVVELKTAAEKDKLDGIILDGFPVLKEASAKASGDGFVVTYSLNVTEVEKIRENSVAQALETIRNRIDQFGVSEPTIIPEGRDRIVLQLPGVTDPERAKKLIGRTALLEFKLVDQDHSVQAALNGDVPAESYIAYMKDGYEPILLKKRTEMTGSLLEDARMSISGRNEPYVSLSFSREGARIFERVTSENVGRQLAIILDGKVHSAPVIRGAISGGKAVIEGRFTDAEAGDLAIILRAGSLPAPVDILEERIVGPSLGKDSIHKGFLSIVFGIAVVILFMVGYYRFSGLLADLALICNIILLLGILSMIGAVLTMPGIAGIVLTIGMAVDANVIVYERIKEELRLGRTAKMAVEAGYRNALSTILDANITTLIAALVLFQFGTGPVKGFAVTLSIGIVSSLFTALVLCRWIMEWFVNVKKIEKLSI